MRMHRVAIVFVSVLVASTLTAQSLTELANKEKKRRKDNDKEAVAELEGSPLNAEERRERNAESNREKMGDSLDSLNEQISRLSASIKRTKSEIEQLKRQCKNDARKAGVASTSDSVSSCRKWRREQDQRDRDSQRLQSMREDARVLKKRVKDSKSKN